MVQSGEALSDVELRRQQIASWIEDAVKPVEHVLQKEIDADALASVGFTDSKTGAIKPEFEVREYQLDAWGALWDARQAGADRGLIHLATGLGKTSVGVFDAMRFREEFKAQHGRNPKIMFTVHQNDILSQAAERFQAFIPEASIGFYNGGEKNLVSDITFATLQSLRANIGQLDPKTFDYIINDEVHHAKAHTYEEVIKHFKPAFRLGLTATPNRADEKDIRELYGIELYSMSLSEALAEGWLASPDYHIVFDDAVKEAMQSGFQADSLRSLQELFSVQPRNDVIANNIKEEMEKIGLEFGSVKTIVFCQNIEHAEEMAELLSGKAYHSQVDRNSRLQIFNEFKKGDLQVITTRDMFNEGVDVPDARLLVFLRSTSSQTIFEQQLGRGLRKAANKDRVSILDFVANVERIAMVQELAENAAGRGNNTGELSGTQGGDGESGVVIEDDSDDLNNGLVIHTHHGDFDFDKMTVDLLDKYSELLSIVEAPEDYMTINAAADALSINRSTVIKICKSNGWELPTYRRRVIGVSLFVSKEQFEILAQHPEASTPRANDKMYSFNTLAKETGVSADILQKMVEEQGWELAMHKFGPKIAPGITSTQLEMLRTAYPDRFVPIAPEGWLSIKQAAKEIGAEYYRTKKMIEENEFKLRRYRPRGKTSVDMLSPEQINKLRQDIENGVQFASAEIISFAALADEVDLPSTTLKRYATDLGIQPAKYRFGRSGTLGEGLTSEQVEIIKADPRISNYAPDGYMNMATFAKKLGIYQQPLDRIVKQLGWDLPKFRGTEKGSRVSSMLSPEQITILESNPYVQELVSRRNQ
jgi:superfamily II DNA or RNA helicase